MLSSALLGRGQVLHTYRTPPINVTTERVPFMFPDVLWKEEILPLAENHWHNFVSWALMASILIAQVLVPSKFLLVSWLLEFAELVSKETCHSS